MDHDSEKNAHGSPGRSRNAERLFGHLYRGNCLFGVTGVVLGRPFDDTRDALTERELRQAVEDLDAQGLVELRRTPDGLVVCLRRG